LYAVTAADVTSAGLYEVTAAYVTSVGLYWATTADVTYLLDFMRLQLQM